MSGERDYGRIEDFQALWAERIFRWAVYAGLAWAAYQAIAFELAWWGHFILAVLGR